MSDFIDRQAAIDAFVKICDRECEYSERQRSVMCGACHLGSAFDVMLQLPSIQPKQRKKGKWMLMDGYRCSNCNWKLQTTGLLMYCPNCDADMRGYSSEKIEISS